MRKKNEVYFPGEDVKQAAREIILQAVALGPFDSTENLKIIETKTDVEFVYSAPLQHHLQIRISLMAIVKNLLQRIVRDLTDQISKEEFEKIPIEVRLSFIRGWTLVHMEAFLFHLYFESVGFTSDLEKLTFGGMDFLENSLVFNENAKKIFTQKTSERKLKLQQLLEKLNERRKLSIAHFESQFVGSLISPQFIFFPIYELILPLWKEAKKLYTKNKGREDSIEIVKRAYPYLYTDLVEKLTLKGVEPAKIAFESTARYLNIPFLEYISESKRKEYLSRSKELSAEVTPEEIKLAYEKYVEFWTRKTDKHRDPQNFVSDLSSKISL